jgi:hypothetical protein
MASSSRNPKPALSEGPAGKRAWLVSMTSLVFIVLQSACTAVIAISGVRVAIGLSALAEATIGIHAPAGGFHRDVIRIPMMIAATNRFPDQPVCYLANSYICALDPPHTGASKPSAQSRGDLSSFKLRSLSSPWS